MVARWMFLLLLLSIIACAGRVEPLGGGKDAGQQPSPPCAPPSKIETLATLDATAGRLVVDANDVFVDTNRGVFRVRKCGGPPEKLSQPEPGQYAATGMVQYDDDILITTSAPTRGGFVRRISKAEGRNDDVFATAATELFGLGVEHSHLVWVEKGQMGGRLWKHDFIGGSSTVIIDVPIAYSFGPIVADELGVVFYAEEGNNHGILYDVRDTSSVATGVSEQPIEIVIGIDPSHLYFTFGHSTNNGVSHVARGEDASHQQVVALARAPYGLSRRRSSLYWSDSTEGTISKCDLSPLDPLVCARRAVIASGEDDPGFVTTDESAVYWSTNRGLLKRAPLYY